MFTLHRGDHKENPEPVSTMTKKSQGCIKSAISDVDSFDVPFPAEAPWKHRALLLALTLFIDFRMFENKQQGGQNRNWMSVEID